MPYPNDIDRFVEKLNKSDKVYVIEEEVSPVNGVYEATLTHDNIIDSSVHVYTGTKLTGEKIDNFILSVPADTVWKRSIKIFSEAAPLYITYESYGDQVEAEDINRLQENVIATQSEIDRYKSANDLVVSNTVNRVTVLENNKAEKTYVDTELLKKANKVETYTKTETDDRIQAVVGAAPDALDTLQELGAALNNDPDFAATMTNQLATKVDKVIGKQLSTEDYSTAEKSKLAGIESNANKYIHPSTHPATMIVEDTTHRFVNDADKANWNGKLNATDNAVSASKLVTGRTIALSGDVTGSVVFDGSTNVTITASVVDDSHNHIIANVDGLQSALDSKETPIGAQVKVDTHANDTVKHITADERANWNAKSNLALGETSATAYRGDRGKIAYDHSQLAHAPSNAQKNSDITKAEIEAKLTGNITTHMHSQYVTQDQLGSAGYGDMLKSIYDSDGDGVVDAAESVPWTGITGKPSTFAPSAHTHDVLSVKPDNFKDGLALPSTYDRGTTVFFSNNPTNKFNGAAYCTVMTIKGYNNMAVVQFIYPYNVDAPIYYRYGLYNSDSWKEWRSIETKGAKTWNDLKGV